MARPASPRQQEKNAKVRNDLMKAAVKVVGKVGYAKASIAKIAELAKVSTGTFYLHFKSKDELYDELLPWANDEVTAWTTDNESPARCYMEYEETFIRRFFDYLLKKPAFLTVMFEAEVAAPAAWERWLAIREASHLAELEAAWDRGEFPGFARSTMPQIATMLTGLRKNLVTRYCDKRNGPERIEEVIEAYLRFLFGALHAQNLEQALQMWRPKMTLGTVRRRA
jgi:AcrR family transcriptional regulator